MTPQIERVDGLHVVVTVDQDRRFAGRAEPRPVGHRIAAGLRFEDLCFGEPGRAIRRADLFRPAPHFRLVRRIGGDRRDRDPALQFGQIAFAIRADESGDGRLVRDHGLAALPAADLNPCVANATPMNETVSLTVHVTTVTDMTLPRWMTPFVRPLFAIPTHMTAQERLMLFQTAVNLPAGFTAVEIGSYLGASTAFLGYAAHTRQGVVHAVDTWSNEAMGAKGNVIRGTSSKRTRPRSVTSSCRIAGVRPTSRRAKGRCRATCCSSTATTATKPSPPTCAIGYPPLKPGGALATHDIDQAGVKRAFDELAGARLTGPPQVFERLLICRPAAPPA